MSARDELPLSIENVLRDLDGFAGLFGNYTRHVAALMPLFDAYRAEVRAEAFREAADDAHAMNNDDSVDPYYWGYGGSKIVEMLRRKAGQ